MYSICVAVMATACCLSYISCVYMDTNYRNKKPDQNKNASCKNNNHKILIQYGGKISSSLCCSISDHVCSNWVFLDRVKLSRLCTSAEWKR